MLYGHLGPMYWGRCLRPNHSGRKVYGWRDAPEGWGVCVFGWFVEWCH